MAGRNQRSAEAAQYVRLYKTARWRKLRQAQLAAFPLCAYCFEQDRITEATVCDHSIAHRGDEELFWNGPFLSLCSDCHNSRAQRRDLGRPTMTFGPDGFPIEVFHVEQATHHRP